MEKTNNQGKCCYCQLNLNESCRAELKTGESYIVEFSPGSTLEVFLKNLSFDNPAEVIVTIGSQVQQQANLQPGQCKTKTYAIADYFGSISFKNQAGFGDTLVAISVKSLQLSYNNPIKLYIPEQNGYIVSACYAVGGLDISRVKQYLPQFSKLEASINLKLSGGSEGIKDGDTVKIETTETSVGEYKVLGAWSTPTLYYYKGGYGKNQEWTIRKKNNIDSPIYYGDEVYFLNHYYQYQWLCVEDSGTWLTTKKDAKVYWQIDAPRLDYQDNYSGE